MVVSLYFHGARECQIEKALFKGKMAYHILLENNHVNSTNKAT